MISDVKANTKALQPSLKVVVFLNKRIAVKKVYRAERGLVLKNKEDTVAYTHLFLRERLKILKKITQAIKVPK